MNLIVAVDNKWGIGKNNQLLFHIKKDFEFFKQTTLNKIVVMGYNTYLSLPNGALKDRINIVLCNNDINNIENCYIAHNTQQLKKLIEKYDTNDVFIIGGGFVYKTFFMYCKYAFVTKINADGEATVFCPNLDLYNNWQLLETSEKFITKNNIEFTFNKYINNNVLDV